jgi:hypothetical protein
MLSLWLYPIKILAWVFFIRLKDICSSISHILKQISFKQMDNDNKENTGMLTNFN